MKRVTVNFPASNENNWSRGCPRCTYGIANAPPLTRACELYLERLVQALNGDIVFCDCRAGTCYRFYLRNRNQILIEEARRDPRMTAYAMRNSHPDIEQAERAIAHSYNMLRPPSIRWVDASQPEPEPAPEPAP